MACSQENKRDFEWILESENYSDILIYPPVIEWEPFQTPQLLMKAFANAGWLCIWTEKTGESHNGVCKLQKGIYAVPEDVVVNTMRDKSAVILLTWMGSLPFVDKLNNCKLWYHILDHLSIFSCYDDSYVATHDYFVNISDYVTYVSSPLKKYANQRADKIYLPNACDAEELIAKKVYSIPKEMSEEIRKHKVIGYFGWIEEWMDFEAIKYVASNRNDYYFVFIGPYAERVKCKIEELSKFNNIIFLGRKKYEELKGYSILFDVAIIPFNIDEMMDCVSPIKFYEYCAYGLPVICSYMPEIVNYESDCIKCYRTREEFLALLDEFTNESKKIKANETNPQVAITNSWSSRARQMIEAFEKSDE